MKKTLCLLVGFLLISMEAFAAKELVVYSARKEHLIKPVFDAYTAKTGIEIKYSTDKAGVLLEKIKGEGTDTPADVFITVDAGNLWYAAQEGLLEPVDSQVLSKNIPEHLRDTENRWFGFSVRARTIIYDSRDVDTQLLSTYEQLADSAWKDRLCLRTSKKVYNQSLVAMMIEEHGIEETERIIEGWVKNLAAPVFSNDTKVMEAVAAGQCDLGIVNTYYYGRLMKKNPELPLKIFWPNQDKGGVHVNVSGGGLVKYSKNKEAAIAFLEWLSTQEAQNLFADLNMEYPANPAVAAHSDVVSWGTFKSNQINVAKAGELQSEAVKLMDRVGYK